MGEWERTLEDLELSSFWKGKRVLLTGHTGFKGSWLAFWLQRLGADVYGYSLAPDSEPNLYEILRLDSLANSTFADIRDLPRFSSFVGEVDPHVVLHLAAQSLVRRSYRLPVDTYSTNVIGTVNVLEACRQAKSLRSVVVVTTDKVYENHESDEGYREGERLGGYDPYSSSKACAELATAAYRDSFFSDGECLVATARAGNVIGGGDWSEDRLLPDIFRALLAREKVVIRNPASVRPWQHVLDPLSGYLQLAEELYRGERLLATAWNFGPTEAGSDSVDAIVGWVKQLWDGDLDVELFKGEQPHETSVLRLDSSRARDVLGWHPRLDVHAAIDMTTQWFRAYRDGEDMIKATAEQIDRYTTLTNA